MCSVTVTIRNVTLTGRMDCMSILQYMSKGSKVPPVNVMVMVTELFGVNRPLVPGLVHICIWL